MRSLLIGSLGSLLVLSPVAADTVVNVISDVPLTISYVEGATKTMELQENDFHNPPFYSNCEFASKALTAPKRPGYLFSGWYTLERNDSDVYGSGTSPELCNVLIGADELLSVQQAESCKTTAYSRGGFLFAGGAVASPKYTKILFDLTYDGNGGAGQMKTVEDLDYESALTLPACMFEKTGWSFAGWKTASGASFADGQAVKGSNFWVEAKWDFDAELVAQWTKNSYEITVAKTGTGSGTVTGGGTYPYGTQVELVATADADSTFMGWTDGELTASRTITVGAADATYTAQFEKIKTYTIVFVYRNANGASVKDERTGIREGESVEPPTKDTVDQWPHHAFVRWESFAYQDVSASAYVNAVYESSHYSLTFDANGGEGVTAALLFESYEEKKTLPKNGFTRTGYAFVGWAREKDAKTAEFAADASVGGLADEGTVVFYAVWDPISYSIEFNGGGASGGATETVSGVRYDEAVVLPKNGFVKTGCAFLHWKCEAEEFADGDVVSNLTATADAIVTLTAIWDSPFFVRFDANGGEGEMDVQRFEMGEAAPLSTNRFTRLGHHFAGWATNGTDVVFADGRRVSEKDFPGTVPGVTNVISAVWNSISLSEAMMVEQNLVWTNSGNAAVVWDAFADQDGSWARQASSSSSKASRQAYLTAPIDTSGRLTLSLRMTDTESDGTVRFWISETATAAGTGLVSISVPADGAWHVFSTNIVTETSAYLHFVNWSGKGNCDISAMTWTPKGADPEYDAKDTPVSSFGMTDGEFGFVFQSAGATYHLLGTNDLVAPMPWPVVFETNAANGEIRFTVPIQDGEPKMFYRIRALK